MPGIGFFAPLPIALFIPFMASQSLAMGEAFGKGFQFGKRKISAMSNEDFNKLSAVQMHADVTAEIKDMIPNMRESMRNFATLQPEIIKQLLDYALTVGEAVVEKGTEVVSETLERASEFDYLKSLMDWIGQQGANNEQATINLLNKSGLGAEARIDQSGKQQQLNNQQKETASKVLAKRARQDIARLEAQVALAVANKSTAGPSITSSQLAANRARASQQANTLSVSGGVVTIKDTRTIRKKPRVPRSQVIQYNKYAQEIRAMINIRSRSRFSKSQLASNKSRIRQLWAKMNGVKNKYEWCGQNYYINMNITTTGNTPCR